MTLCLTGLVKGRVKRRQAEPHNSRHSDHFRVGGLAGRHGCFFFGAEIKVDMYGAYVGIEDITIPKKSVKPTVDVEW